MGWMDNLKRLYHQNNVNLYHRYVMISGYLRSLKPQKYTMDDPIDFVVTWVDGNDPEWRAQKNEYFKILHPEIKGNGEERYRDWGLFKYWFRAVEKYAPWVRNVYLVTYGHVPEWINRDCPKLKIVKHSDFMDVKYLPTFNSVPIELNLHRIEGLSEHFVYFNDDMFLAAHVKPTDFFGNGLPKHCGVAFPVKNDSEDRFHRHQRFSVMGQINGKTDPQKYIPKHPEKWFSFVYGADIKYNKRALSDGYVTGFYFSHLGCPFRKSTMDRVWQTYSEKLNESCMNRFRSPTDIMHQIFSAWELINGSFVPIESTYLGIGFNKLDKQIDRIENAFASQNHRMICLNDNKEVGDYERTCGALQRLMECIFPKKSEFEK